MSARDLRLRHQDGLLPDCEQVLVLSEVESRQQAENLEGTRFVCEGSSEQSAR